MARRHSDAIVSGWRGPSQRGRGHGMAVAGLDLGGFLGILGQGWLLATRHGGRRWLARPWPWDGGEGPRSRPGGLGLGRIWAASGGVWPGASGSGAC
jgi:hypothetical protein